MAATSYRRSGEFQRRSGEYAKYEATTPPVAPRTPTPPQLRLQASTNVRRHVWRAVVRVAVLLLSDIAVLFLANEALDAARQLDWSAQWMGVAVRHVFRNGYLNAWHFSAAVIIGLAVMGTYGKGDKRRTSHLILLGVALGTGLQLWSSFWVWILPVTLTRYCLTVALIGLALIASRKLLDDLVRRVMPLRRRMPRVVLIGRELDCERMIGNRSLSSTLGFEIVDIIATDRVRVSGAYTVHPLDELEYLIHEKRADTTLLCGYPGSEAIGRAMRAAISSECQVLSWNPSYDVSGAQPSLVSRNGYPLLEWRAPALRWWQMLAKRALDICISASALILLAPVMLIIAIFVRLGSRGRAIFGQPRLGRFGRVFRCYKFRSMYEDAEDRLRSDPELHAEYVRNDFKLPTERDNRITKIGRFLRKTSLDELPQLWNVFWGEMSLVGPRPIVPDELQHYQGDTPLFLSLKPGMTGAWQVNGRSSVAYPQRSEIELEYVQGWSLGSDMSILLRTLPAVIFGRGAH
jgi:exopolysaccharide production protein ExoY